MNVICMVQARMGSSRLPGKVLHKLKGKPLIEHILESLSFSKEITQLIVVTTNNPQDNVLVDYLIKSDWKYFRGDEEDVLKRYVDAIKIFGGDYIVRITADNPLIDPEIVDEVIRNALNNNVEYASNDLEKTYPLGYSVEVISRNVLEKLEELTTEKSFREHVTFYILKNPKLFKILNVRAPDDLCYPDWRLTVDTKEDFKLLEIIFENLYSKNQPIKYKDVVRFLKNNPNLLKINRHIKQKLS